MVNTPLDLRLIYKRERYLEKNSSLSENAEIPKLSGVSDSHYRNMVDNYLKECNNFRDVLTLMEILYKDNKFDILEAATQVMINDIIPAIKPNDIGFDHCIEEFSVRNIGNVNIDRLIETAKTYKSIDRIKKNHKNLTKRFGFDNYRNLSDRKRCFSVCEKVCTYNLSPYIKFNIALEEVSYLEFINGKNMSNEDMVKHITEYFLMISENTNETIDSYKNAIKNSKVIKENADSKIKFLTENDDNSYGYIKEIHNWLINPNKTIDQIIEIARNNFDNISSLNHIIDTINEFVSINSIDDFDSMTIFKEFKSLSANEAKNIVTVITENNISNAEDLVNNLWSLWESEVNDTVYDDGTKIPETFTSDDIDKFKMHNLITDAQSTGEFLNKMEKSYMNKMIPITKIESIKSDADNIDESNIVNYIDENGYISLKLGSYMYNGDTEKTNSVLESTINCINNSLYGKDTVAYYSIGENTFDISVRSKYKIITSFAQDMCKGISESNKCIISNILAYSKAIQSIDESAIYSIIDKLRNDRYYAATVTAQEVSLIADILNPYITPEDNIMEEFIEICREEANQGYDKMKRSLSCIVEEQFNPYENHKERIQFCADVMGITEAENKDNENGVKKKAINSLNDAKLAWTGIKSKLKGLSAKEQEMSRDLDTEFNHLIKVLGNAFTTDHREEIITGEINRSLSKAIKIAIGLAGAGFAAGKILGLGAAAPALPIIAAITLFAKSKFSSVKEKKMIIDEIDIELQVLEREINRAEQAGSTKKYRQLLTIQKNLMRRRQEIYYGLAKKGQRIPMQATEGLRGRE